MSAIVKIGDNYYTEKNQRCNIITKSVTSFVPFLRGDGGGVLGWSSISLTGRDSYKDLITVGYFIVLYANRADADPIFFLEKK